MRYFAFGLATAFALAGCATTNTVYPRQAAPHAPQVPSGPSIFTDAPQAALHSELFACNGGGGSNIGEIGWRGEVLAYAPYMHTPAGVLLRNPTEAACLSSGFGWRSTANGGGRQHSGLDLANPNGGFVFAAADGWVSTVEWRGGYGLVIEIDHGRSVRTLYAHLNEANPELRSGVFVSSGTAIARMGATGNATGVHLHYEVSVDGLTVDPLNYGREPPALF